MKLERLFSLTISQKIILGNSLIIIVGAIAGTLITRNLTYQAADPLLILFFSSAGIFLSVSLNAIILRTALKPLSDLRNFVSKLQNNPDTTDVNFEHSDPDIAQLVSVLKLLLGQIQQRNRELQALSQQAICAQEEERKRIAQSLHDDTGQALSSLVFSLERLENRLADESSDLKEKISSCRILATNTLKELRKIILDLRPSILDDLGLIPAIRWYGRSRLEEAGIRFNFSAPEDFPPLPDWISTCLFRISQEAINNIVKHSKATQARITLQQEIDGVSLTIQDNGIGFQSEEYPQLALDEGKWGLLGMKERAESIQAILKVNSSEQKGTTVTVFVPLHMIQKVS
ncbi:MAG: two-component sensor histidine kinase [Anaerolineae bacterium]|jgi:two-component system sensor histidine kinase UhpB|nr:MAG: two-component sensor histidine kinase [Anaerolineae bacterium]